MKDNKPVKGNVPKLKGVWAERESERLKETVAKRIQQAWRVQVHGLPHAHITRCVFVLNLARQRLAQGSRREWVVWWPDVRRARLENVEQEHISRHIIRMLYVMCLLDEAYHFGGSRER